MAVTFIDFHPLLYLSLVIWDRRSDIFRTENCRAVKIYFPKRININIFEHANLRLVRVIGKENVGHEWYVYADTLSRWHVTALPEYIGATRWAELIWRMLSLAIWNGWMHVVTLCSTFLLSNL